MLDKKLKEIKVKCYDGGYYLNDSSLSDENIAQIKQVFADEQLQDFMTSYAGTKKLNILPPKLMTGQEWLDRFEKELREFVGEARLIRTTSAIKAAHKASGVDKW